MQNKKEKVWAKMIQHADNITEKSRQQDEIINLKRELNTSLSRQRREMGALIQYADKKADDARFAKLTPMVKRSKRNLLIRSNTQL